MTITLPEELADRVRRRAVLLKQLPNEVVADLIRKAIPRPQTEEERAELLARIDRRAEELAARGVTTLPEMLDGSREHFHADHQVMP